jgi:hypothetical protein
MPVIRAFFMWFLESEVPGIREEDTGRADPGGPGTLTMPAGRDAMMPLAPGRTGSRMTTDTTTAGEARIERAVPRALVRVAPYAIAVASMAVTMLILRPNMWLLLQGDSAFYQSLSENGAAPVRAGQDLAYFPQRLSLLVPERLVVLLLGEHAGYLALRWGLAAALTLLAVASLPRSARLASAGLVGVLCATTPPAIGWLSQNYPTLTTGPAIAAGAVACVALLTVTTPGRARLLWAGLGIVAGLTVHGHWGTGPYAIPVFVAGGLIMLAPSRRRLLVHACVGFVVATLITLVALSLLGLWLFDVGTPAQLWAMQERGFAQIEKVNAAWVGFSDWGWVWWQTTLVLWAMAIALPLVLRARTGRWWPSSLVLSGIVAGQLVVGTLLDPIGLGNTQYNPQIWPLALLAITHAVAVVAASGTTPGGSTPPRWSPTLLIGGAALVAAWAGAHLGAESGLTLRRSAALALAVLGIVSLAPALVRRLRAGIGAAEALVSASALVMTTFVVATAQTIPPGVVSQGTSPAYPDLSPQAWIDYSSAYGPTETSSFHRALYLGASVVSEATYRNCPSGVPIQYWSSPVDGYLGWAVFSPYNTASTPYPQVPDSPSPLCLVAIGAPWSWAESAPVDGTRARLLTEVPLRATYHAPDLDYVVRVYEVLGPTP